MLNKRNRVIGSIITYVSLIFFTAICIFPFVWMIISALKPKNEVRVAEPTFLSKRLQLKISGVYWLMWDFYNT